MSTTTVNIVSVAAAFILGLFQPNDLICIMELKDGQAPIHLFLPANYVATAQFLQQIQKDNEAGFNIYVAMNPFKLGTRNRKKEFVARVSHVWAEIDNDAPAWLERINASPNLPNPHFVLRSSAAGNHKADRTENLADKLHVIWNVEDMSVNALESLERALVAFGNDKQAVDAVRVLRVPGFKNCKYAERPMVELLSQNDRQPYRREDFKFTDSGGNGEFKPPYQLPESVEEGNRNSELFKYACSLRSKGCNQDEILAAIQTVNDSRGNPPLPDEEIRTIVGSAMKYSPAEQAVPTLGGQSLTVEPATPAAIEQIEPIAEDSAIPDMSEAVLSGRLGEICQKRLSQFPIAYSWPTVLTVAGVMVPKVTGGLIIDPPQTNLYTVQIGPVGSGKSQVIDHARRIMNLPDCMYSDVKAGSSEGLLLKLSKDVNSGKLLPNILQDLDEWKHYFKKAEIDGASFMTIMNTGFYKDHYHLVIARGKEINFDCTISWIGGVVQEEYDDVIGSAAMGGFYDRLLQGVAPTGYMLDYRPYEGEPETFSHVPVKLDGSVWEVAKDWRKQYPEAGRLIEVVIRTAHICASFDGRSVLRGENLQAAEALLKEQLKVRAQFAPNIGENAYARCQAKIIQALPSNGGWMNMYDLKRRINYGRFGAGIFLSCIQTLASPLVHDIEVQTQKRVEAKDLILVRRVIR